MAAKSMREVIESGKLKRYIDPNIIKALSHPVREHILAVLNERIASPKEVADELEIDVSFLDYHFEVLLDLGCAEIVDVKPRRGSNEHFYQAKTTLIFDNEMCHAIPESVKSDVATGQLQAILKEAVQAVSTGTFAVGGDRHVCWMPAVLDRSGWEEAMTAMERLLFALMEIHRRAARRVALGGEAGIPVTIALMGFGTAPDVA